MQRTRIRSPSCSPDDQPLVIGLTEGDPERAYAALGDVRKRVEADDSLAEGLLYSVIYLQGVAAIRRGENDNCLECRGDGACILPIEGAAIHTKPAGLV